MPFYTFTCSACNAFEQFNVPVSQKTGICLVCGSPSTRNLPKINGPTIVKEVADKHSNRRNMDNQVQILKDRKEEYFWKVEVPRLVQSHSVQTSLENDWIYLDDAGGVHVHTKPPSQR